MFQVRFTEFASREILSFIRQYEEGFFSLYYDSGLINQESILMHYRQAATTLLHKIVRGIEEHLKPTKILGRKEQDGTLQEAVFHIANRLVITYYSEDKQARIRRVERVGIDRKPIIF